MSNHVLFGLALGGIWNAANLWCLAQLLKAWLGPQPSRRRVVGWLLVKFPLLYLAAIGALRHPAVSLVGFSIGFSLVLLAAIWRLAARTPHLATSSHGR